MQSLGENTRAWTYVTFTVKDAQDEAVSRPVTAALVRRTVAIGWRGQALDRDGDGSEAAIPDDPRILHYEDLLATGSETELDGRIADERTAAALCYTTGTPGNPKGVPYSHRSI